MVNLLNIPETMVKVASKTGLSADNCEKVIAAAVDVLHEEMVRRGNADRTLYCTIQDGVYYYSLGEHLEPSTFLPGDWWTEICRRSTINYPQAEKVVSEFRDIWIPSKQFFEPLGTIETANDHDNNTFYMVNLRRDFIGPNLGLENTDNTIESGN